MLSKHFKLIESSTKVNLVQSYIAFFYILSCILSHKMKTLRYYLYAITWGELIIGNDGAVRLEYESHGCKILYENGDDYWVYIARLWDANPNTIYSFCTNIGGITGGFLFTKALIQYHDTKPKLNTFITSYCNNKSAICRAKYVSFSQGIKHHIIPRNHLINELHIDMK